MKKSPQTSSEFENLSKTQKWGFSKKLIEQKPSFGYFHLLAIDDASKNAKVQPIFRTPAYARITRVSHVPHKFTPRDQTFLNQHFLLSIGFDDMLS